MARKPASPRQPLHIVKGRPPGPRKPGKRSLVLLGLALTIVPTALLAQGLVTRQTGITAYRQAMGLLESHKASVEQVFYRGLVVRDLLLKEDSRGTALVETLSSTEFEALKKEFSGFILGRDEFVFANPDPVYFAGLARDFGDAADQAFFDAYRHTRPAGVWPVWIEQETDVAGCTRFGQGSLVSSYRLWSDFRQKYPRKYRSTVDEILATIEDQLSAATCACGDSGSVSKELQEFEEAFPQSRVSDLVKQRIRDLQEDRSKIQFSCTAGPASRIVR